MQQADWKAPSGWSAALMGELVGYVFIVLSFLQEAWSSMCVSSLAPPSPFYFYFLLTNLKAHSAL